MLRFAGKKEKDGMTRYMYRTDMSVIDLFKSLRDASSRSMLFIRDAKYSLPNPEYEEWVATSSDPMSDAGSEEVNQLFLPARQRRGYG